MRRCRRLPDLTGKFPRNKAGVNSCLPSLRARISIVQSAHEVTSSTNAARQTACARLPPTVHSFRKPYSTGAGTRAHCRARRCAERSHNALQYITKRQSKHQEKQV